MNKLKSNDERAKMAKMMIWFLLFTQILMFGAHFLHCNMATDILAGNEVSEATIELNDTRIGVLALLHIVVFIISVITFTRWFQASLL